MLYTIIGGDGKEYGSVLTDDLRRWIAEGRLNADSLAKAEGEATFRPLSSFPEIADAFAPPAAAAAAPPPFPTATGLADGDYDLDIGGCLTRGWNLYKENFGILFVASLLFVVGMYAPYVLLIPINKLLMHAPVALQLGFGFLFPLVTSLVVGPLAGGVCLVYLRTIREQGATVGDVFAGFQKAFAQLYLGTLAVAWLASVCFLPFNYVFQAKAAPLLLQLQDAQAQHATAEIQNLTRDLLHAYGAALPVLLICLIPFTYLVVSFQFTSPLIIDRGMKFWPAMKTSFKMVNRHWWLVLGLTVLVGLVSGVGLCGCLIGALFTVPIGIAAAMYAYETIFSRPPTG